MTAAELLAAYAARERSPVEVVAELSAAVEADPHGAFWATCLERAAEEARAAEAAWGRGEARPLEGVPIAVKDLFDTAGVETTYGSAIFRGHIPERDAEAVGRVRAAGAIVLGKTATHEFAWGFSSINDALGTVRNPRDPERVAGGSSGGSGAALAAGLAPLALGTDTGGSIRVPSAFCEVYGLKPTFGRVSLDGVWPLARTLDHAGPMARTPDDLALLLGVLAPVPSHVAATPPRVVVCPDLHSAPLEPQIAAAHAETGLRLGAGEVAFGEAELIVPAFRSIQLAEGHETHRATGLWPGRAAEYGADVRGRVELGAEVTMPRLLAAHADRERLRAAFARLFVHADVLLTPAVPLAPPRIEDERARPALREAVLAYTAPQDLIGLPACVLPNGMQLTGPPGAEALLVAVAASLAKE
ncbi:MAG TPA: amidase [Solirubrobacteraceae bacterium]|nr:amidase [Solirubrobacteraceae bacterium]